MLTPLMAWWALLYGLSILARTTHASGLPRSTSMTAMRQAERECDTGARIESALDGQSCATDTSP